MKITGLNPSMQQDIITLLPFVPSHLLDPDWKVGYTYRFIASHVLLQNAPFIMWKKSL